MKFNLRTNKVNGTASLYARIQRKGTNILLNTNVKVDIEKWNKANSSALNWQKFVSSRYGYDINCTLEEINNVIESCKKRNWIDKAILKQAIDDVVFRKVRKEEEDAKVERAETIKEEMKNRDSNPAYFTKKFIEGIKDGTIRNKGRQYNENTIKSWVAFGKIITEFCAEDTFTFDEIDKEIVDRFVSFLEKKSFLAKTINKLITNFRAIANYALTVGVCTDIRVPRMFYKISVNESDKKAEIYLTENELQELYDMPLIGTKALYRDVFLIGCYTCQRFSDYSILKEHNFSITAKGTRVVRLDQIKTGNSIVIPVLNGNLMEICRRYNFTIPPVSDVVMDRYIKDILEKLSEKVPSLADDMPTVLSMKEKKMEEDGKKVFRKDEFGRYVKHRYELVSTHTARRTGITLLYLTGKFDTVQMMSISGHKDVKTFIEYIRLTKDEMADAIAKKAKDDAKQVVNDGLF